MRATGWRRCTIPTADIDKNEAISALEAFQYADRKTAEFYESQKRLATEHAVFEDTGRASRCARRRPKPAKDCCSRISPCFALGAAQKAANDPAKRDLLAKKEELEQKIDTLKYQKAAMAEDDYKKQLTAALLELARVQEELDK